MRFFVRCWLVAVLLMPAAAYAGSCRAVSFRHHAVIQKVVVVEKVIAAAVVVPVVAQFVQVPLYSAFYSPAYVAPYAAPPAYQQPVYAPPAPVAPVAQAPCPDHSGTFRKVESILQQIDARLQRLEGGPAQPPPVVPMPPADPPNGKPPVDPFNPNGQPPAQTADRLLSLSVTHCSQCHDKNRAASSGKGFVLLEGGRFSASLTPESLGKIISEVTSGRMPKGGKMTPEEKLEFVSLLVAGPPK